MSNKERIIKRYQNRKLYDTYDSCYVTLDEIGHMVKDGHDVKIIDNKSGEDLTSVTLTQIIFEEEKKKKSILPLDTLKKIIQNPGQQVVDFFQKSITEGVSSISNVRDEAEKVLGKISEQGSKIKDNFLKSNHTIDELIGKIEEKFSNTPEETNVNNIKSELRALRKKLATIERKLKDKN